MQTLTKEGLIVSSFILLCVLDKIDIQFMGIITMLALPISIGLLIYVIVTNAKIKTNTLQSIYIILEIYYKMFFLLALYYIFKDYPGKDIMSIVAIGNTLLYIIFATINKAKKDFVFSAILYTIVFSSFSLLVRF